MFCAMRIIQKCGSIVDSSTRRLLSSSVGSSQLRAAVEMPNVQPPLQLLEPANIPEKRLFGPGPSNLREKIKNALTQPMLGHLHPEFLKVMDDVREGLKYVFQTNNKLTFVVSGTGHAGMECSLLNLLERGEKVLIVRNGIWGERAASLSRRLGFDVEVLDIPDGEAANLEMFRSALEKVKPAVAFVCQGESSTGVLHPLEGFGSVCHEFGTLLLVDTVASLCATPFDADQLHVDCVYSASQKVLNAPPGLAPISFSDLAVQKIKNRKTPIPSFYFDALELGNYWGCWDEPRRYHHTGPVSLVYSLREALAAIVQEGLDESVQRHERNAKVLYELLETCGFELFVKDLTLRLPCLTTVCVPQGVNWKETADLLMSNGRVEIAGGLGNTAGKIWRIGTFGRNSNIDCFHDIPSLLKTAAKI